MSPRHLLRSFVLLVGLGLAGLATAQTPALVPYQGRVQTGSPAADFNGTGQFRFALMQGNSGTRLWVNNGPTTGNPVNAVSLTVTNGLYSVLLGDPSIPNMAAIPPAVFLTSDVRLRVWFNGTQLSPDQRLAPNGYLPSGTHVAAGSGTVPPANGLSIFNGTNTANQHAILSARVAGPAAGNPFLSLDVTGEGGWSIGLDNQDSNKLKFSAAWDGFYNSRMVLQNSGDLAITGIGTMLAMELRAAGLTPYLDFSADNDSDFGARIIYTSADDFLSISGASRLAVESGIRISPGGNLESLGRLHLQSGTNQGLYLNPFADGGDVIVGGGSGQGNLRVVGTVTVDNNLSCAKEMTCVAVNITSDRNAKEGFTPVDSREVLAKVAALPITEWQYKTQSGARHIGPMAQDFRDAFSLGHDEKHITTVDADGIALAAIQGLNGLMKEKDAELDRLKDENQALSERLAAIEKALGLTGTARAGSTANRQ